MNQGQRALELNEDPRFQVRSWTAERVGWTVMTGIVLAALAGWIGPGPLGHRKVEASNGFRVDYDRYIRTEAPATLRLRLPPRAAGIKGAHFWLTLDFVRHVHLQTITPQPEHAEAVGDRLHYTLQATVPDRPVEVTLHFEPEGWGSLDGSAGLADGASVHFEQFVYP
jgi:hypothetical protein